jgi:hypothetical protein
MSTYIPVDSLESLSICETSFHVGLILAAREQHKTSPAQCSMRTTEITHLNISQQLSPIYTNSTRDLTKDITLQNLWSEELFCDRILNKPIVALCNKLSTKYSGPSVYDAID